MILDTIENALDNIEHYSKIHPLFPAALKFLETAHTLEDGRYQIQGDSLYAMVVTAPLRDISQAPLEAHRSYIDIQMPLFTNAETYAWSALNDCHKQKGDYSPEDDIIFFEDTPFQQITALPNDLLFFFPHDAHAPLIGTGTVRKVIVKVKQ